MRRLTLTNRMGRRLAAMLQPVRQRPFANRGHAFPAQPYSRAVLRQLDSRARRLRHLEAR